MATWENHPIRSRPFQLFLLRTYYRETGKSPGAQAIRAALELFEAKALFDGEESPINLRVANHRGKLYLDLCDRAWRAVEIDCRRLADSKSTAAEISSHTRLAAAARTRARRQSRRAYAAS